MVAVGQGGGRGSTLLYSLRFLPERLQAVAPGCCHFALATWIHRQPDPWLTLQVELSNHPLQYSTIASCLPLPGKPAQFKSNLCKRFWHCLLQSENNNNASKCMPCSVPFLPCRWPVFSCITFPLLLRIAVYIYYVFLNMPTKWTSQMAPGTKFLRLLGSLCARAHPQKQQETSDKEKTKFKKKNFKCIWKTRMYGVTLEIYWLIELAS